MKIIVDAMGGDNAPLAPVEGALQAAEKLGVEVLLAGRTDDITAALAQLGRKELPGNVSIVHADEVITMEDNPARAFREKKNSSMTICLEQVKNGEADAMVSAGSTGALLSGATLLVKRIRGIRRAALAPVVPNGGSGMVLMDSGATAECTPEYLLQYAFMGSYYAKRFLGRAEPRVGLLNIGVEPSKGLDLHRETYGLLEKAHAEGRIHFVGNIEAREAICEDAVDVLVTDGFTGNILLKSFEGCGKLFSRELKKMFLKSLKTKISALMMKSGVAEFKKTFDPNEVGGTAMLGICKPVIKAHGSSNGYAFYNAIRQAKEVAASGIMDDITANVEYMRLPAGKTEA